MNISLCLLLIFCTTTIQGPSRDTVWLPQQFEVSFPCVMQKNIIFHASHAEFTCNTHSIHAANIWVTVKSHMEYYFVCRIFWWKSGKTTGITCKPKRAKTIHAHYIMNRASEERKYGTSTFNEKNSLIFLFDYATSYDNKFSFFVH